MNTIPDNYNEEKTDFVIQDREVNEEWSGIVHYMLEVKSDLADCEVANQLKKAVQLKKIQNKDIGQKAKVVGVVVARRFTKTCLNLLWGEGFRTIQWVGNGEDKHLINISAGFYSPAYTKKAITKEILATIADMTVKVNKK